MTLNQAASSAPRSGATVYVVDDDASVRKSLERLLGSVGYRVQTYGSAREFLAHPPAGSSCSSACASPAQACPSFSPPDSAT